MDKEKQTAYYTHSITNDPKFKNKVLEYRIDKYKEIIKILWEYADGNWLHKNDYGEQYGEDEEHNDEEYVSDEIQVFKLYGDIDKIENELLKYTLDEMIKRQDKLDDIRIVRKKTIILKEKRLSDDVN